MVYAELVIGLVLLLVSGEVLIRSAVTAARQLGVSPLFIGITLVGFGTSTPELVASVIAALQGAPGIAVGNVVGTNIANVLLVLGLAAIIAPLPCDPQAYRRDSWFLLGSMAVMVMFALNGYIGRPLGLASLVLMVLLVIYAYRLESTEHDAGAQLHEAEADSIVMFRLSLVPCTLVLAASIAGVIGGAALLVDSAVAIARLHGVSDTLIGVTVVALGTSLPELAIAGLAAYRGQADVAIGNIVGSNVYNILFILGVTAVVQPIEVPADIVWLDLWVMAVSTVVLLLFMQTGRRISRLEGIGFVVAYLLYLAVRTGLVPGYSP